MARTPSWSRPETSQQLADLDASGLTVAEFARQRGISADRLYWARRQARAAAKKRGEPATTREFTEVVVSDLPSPAAASIELRLPTGIAIGVSADFDEVTLRRLLGVLTPC